MMDPLLSSIQLLLMKHLVSALLPIAQTPQTVCNSMQNCHLFLVRVLVLFTRKFQCCSIGFEAGVENILKAHLSLLPALVDSICALRKIFFVIEFFAPVLEVRGSHSHRLAGYQTFRSYTMFEEMTITSNYVYIILVLNHSE
ncbi:hypothetical protein B0H13DRAFT_2341822 [Mycena leptocephala]|nr:hypothetical protein B0H13DRAFT_2341822 [Mycena leptocephala]